MAMNASSLYGGMLLRYAALLTICVGTPSQLWAQAGRDSALVTATQDDPKGAEGQTQSSAKGRPILNARPVATIDYNGSTKETKRALRKLDEEESTPVQQNGRVR